MAPSAAAGVAGRDTIRAAVLEMHEVLRDLGIRHALAYGTLLGAVRSGDVIEWDDDFDFFVDPQASDRLLAERVALKERGLAVYRNRRPGGYLAINPGGVRSFDAGSIGVYRGTLRVGDLFCPSPFRDGVLRLFDFTEQVYWCPHTSFPAYFLEELGEVELCGRALPAPRDAERWLAGVYGTDWRQPYRAVKQGGAPRAGVTIHGDRFAPKLAAEVAWCRDRGWDPGPYADSPAWPQAIRGAGPVGPCERTQDSSRALWWRDVDELTANF